MAFPARPPWRRLIKIAKIIEQSPGAPKSWTQRAYRNLIYFNEVDNGGHFAAGEQPELFSAELRAAGCWVSRFEKSTAPACAPPLHKTSRREP
jgi:hypothetical protein